MPPGVCCYQQTVSTQPTDHLTASILTLCGTSQLNQGGFCGSVMRFCYVQVVACIERVQQALVSSCPEMQPCLLEPITAHMTLMVLNLPTQVCATHAH